jgi:hypothetical protein
MQLAGLLYRLGKALARGDGFVDIVKLVSSLLLHGRHSLDVLVYKTMAGVSHQSDLLRRENLESVCGFLVFLSESVLPCDGRAALCRIRDVRRGLAVLQHRLVHLVKGFLDYDIKVIDRLLSLCGELARAVELARLRHRLGQGL